MLKFIQFNSTLVAVVVFGNQIIVIIKEVLNLRWNEHHLFWNANDSIVKLMLSIASGFSCDTDLGLNYYKNMLNYDNDNKYRKLTTI